VQLPEVGKGSTDLEPHERMEILTDLSLARSYEFLSLVITPEEAAADMGKRRLYLAQQQKADSVLQLVVRIRDEQQLRQSRREKETVAELIRPLEAHDAAAGREPRLSRPPAYRQ